MPLAWTFTALAHLGVADERSVLIAHLVMDVILLAFVGLSWNEMSEGVLSAWRTVILLGTLVTLAGTASFLIEPATATLQTISVVGWMILPAWGLWVTGQRVPADERGEVYTAGAAVSLVGAVVYLTGSIAGGVLAGWLVGIALVGVGQSAGIVLAVVEY